MIRKPEIDAKRRRYLNWVETGIEDKPEIITRSEQAVTMSDDMKKNYIDELGELRLRHVTKLLYAFISVLADTPIPELVSKHDIKIAARDFLKDLERDYAPTTHYGKQ